MCCGNSILQKGLPFFYLHKIFYTLQKTVVYGISLLILSIIPFFLLTLLWVIPGVLGIIAGLMLLIRKS